MMPPMEQQEPQASAVAVNEMEPSLSSSPPPPPPSASSTLVLPQLAQRETNGMENSRNRTQTAKTDKTMDAKEDAEDEDEDEEGFVLVNHGSCSLLLQQKQQEEQFSSCRRRHRHRRHRRHQESFPKEHQEEEEEQQQQHPKDNDHVESLSEFLWKQTKLTSQDWVTKQTIWNIIARLEAHGKSQSCPCCPPASTPPSPITTAYDALLHALAKLLQRLGQAAATTTTSAAAAAAAAASSSSSSASAAAAAMAAPVTVAVVVVGVGVVLPLATLVDSFSKLKEACQRVDRFLVKGEPTESLQQQEQVHWDLWHALESILQDCSQPLALLTEQVLLLGDWERHCRAVGISLLRARRLFGTFLAHWEPWYTHQVKELQQGKTAARNSGITKLGVGGTSGLVAAAAAAAAAASSSSSSSTAMAATATPFFWTTTTTTTVAATAATGGTAAAAAAAVATAAATAAVAASAAAGTDFWATRHLYQSRLAQLQEFAHAVLQLQAQLDRHWIEYKMVLQQQEEEEGGGDSGEWNAWWQSVEEEFE